MREEVDKQVSESLEKEVIKLSTLTYNTSLWVVPKKPDQSAKPRWHVVLDFQHFTKKLFPWPILYLTLPTYLIKFGNACYYTVISSVSGFHQIALEKADTHKTAFSTPSGHFKFVRIPFGLRDAAPEYQRAMDITLDGMIGKGVFVYHTSTL